MKHDPLPSRMSADATLSRGCSCQFHGLSDYGNTLELENVVVGGSAADGPKHHRSDLERHYELAAGDAIIRNKREPQQTPSLERYLCEGNPANEWCRREREDYPQGSPGMRQYLHDWEQKWSDASKCDTQGKYQHDATHGWTLLMPECKKRNRYRTSPCDQARQQRLTPVQTRFNGHCFLSHDIYRVMGIYSGFAATNNVEPLAVIICVTGRPISDLMVGAGKILSTETDIIMYWMVCSFWGKLP